MDQLYSTVCRVQCSYFYSQAGGREEQERRGIDICICVEIDEVSKGKEIPEAKLGIVTFKSYVIKAYSATFF